MTKKSRPLRSQQSELESITAVIGRTPPLLFNPKPPSPPKKDTRTNGCVWELRLVITDKIGWKEQIQRKSSSHRYDWVIRRKNRFVKNELWLESQPWLGHKKHQNKTTKTSKQNNKNIKTKNSNSNSLVSPTTVGWDDKRRAEENATIMPIRAPTRHLQLWCLLRTLDRFWTVQQRLIYRETLIGIFLNDTNFGATIIPHTNMTAP